MAYGSSAFGSESYGGSLNITALGIITYFLSGHLSKANITITFTLDAKIVLRSEKTFILDAKIVSRPQKTFTLDAALQKKFTKTFTIDGLPLKTGISKSFAIDSRLIFRRESTFTLDALLQKEFTKTFTISARTYVIKYWLSGWKYRIPLTITGSSGVLTNYQIPVTIHYGAGINTTSDVYLNNSGKIDFSDLRFTTQDGKRLLDYWIYESIDYDYAKVWVEVNYIPSSPDTTYIYMYYGNSSAASLSNADNTMIFWDNFDSGLGKWTQPGNVITVDTIGDVLHIGNPGYNIGSFGGIKSNLTFKQATYGDYILEYINFDYTFNTLENNLFIGVADSSIFNITSNIADIPKSRRAGYQGTEDRGKKFWASNGLSDTLNTITIDWSIPRKVAIAWHGNSSSLLIDDSVLSTISNLNDDANFSAFINFEAELPDDIFVDYIWIRKYALTLPTLGTWGLQESLSINRTMSRTHRVGLRIING